MSNPLHNFPSQRNVQDGSMVGRGLPALASVSPSVVTQGNAPAAYNPPENSPTTRGVPFDPRRYRAMYPDMWRSFLHAHFRDAVHVSYFFAVDGKTGRDWWDGVSRSQGWAVAYAIEEIPAAKTFLKVVK